MHNPANFTNELPLRKKRLTRSVLIPIALMVVVLASLFTTGSQSNDQGENRQLATMADGDLLNWSGNWDCSDFLPWLPPCTVPRPNNPPVGVICEEPELTVAILIDRSDSVIRDTGGSTPGIFKDSVELFLDDLYDRFHPFNGRLNFLIYAFGTKAVIQNDRDSFGNFITDASSPSALAAMKQTIENIHFRNGELYANKNLKPNGFQSRTGNPSDLAKAYDAGSESAAGVYGLTNWQDPLVQVLRAQSGPYNSPEPGEKIDLAVMFTDGFPDKSNDKDWDWTPGQFEGNDTIGYSWNEFAAPTAVAQEYVSRYGRDDDLYRPGVRHNIREHTQEVVDTLRSGGGAGRGGFGGGFYAARPPVSVRSIMIRPNATQAVRDEAQWWGDQVFLRDNYYFATDFDEGLQNEITGMAQDIMEETGCDNLINPVQPGVTLTVYDADENNITNGAIDPMEGGPGEILNVHVTNSGQGDLRNVKVCFVPITTNPTSECAGIEIGNLENGATEVVPFNFPTPLGAPDGNYKFVVFYESTATDEELAAAGANRTGSTDSTLDVDYGRLPLPA